eukprot:scaffold15780_cov68-Phaeocystis_antarctica.AAC.11
MRLSDDWLTGGSRSPNARVGVGHHALEGSLPPLVRAATRTYHIKVCELVCELKFGNKRVSASRIASWCPWFSHPRNYMYLLIGGRSLFALPWRNFQSLRTPDDATTNASDRCHRRRHRRVLSRAWTCRQVDRSLGPPL